MNNYYRIYAKLENQKQFKALDVVNGMQVGNLLYATVYKELENAKKDYNYLVENNQNITFEIRKV